MTSGNKRHDLTGRPEGGAALSFLGPGVLEILDALPFYVLLIDKDHRILLANKASREALGLEPEQMVGQHCPKLVHDLDEGVYEACPLEEAVVTNRPVENEHFDDKMNKWLKIAIYPTEAWTTDGKRIYFHMIEDITERKEQVVALHMSEEKHRLLLEELLDSLKK